MLIASWGKPEVYHHAVVKKHSVCRVTASVQRALNRIETVIASVMHMYLLNLSWCLQPVNLSCLLLNHSSLSIRIPYGSKFSQEKVSYKTFQFKRVNFRDKIFVKNQIDTSYYIGNIRRQNEFIFHMHTKQLQNIQSSQLTSYLVDLHSYSYRCTEDIV